MHVAHDAYYETTALGAGGDDPLALFDDGRDLDPREFRDLLAASACSREPICVFGQETDGQWAEVYEREAGAISPLGRFLVRLVVRDAGQYLVILSDLPGLLAQLERFSSLLATPLSVPASTPASVHPAPATPPTQ